MKAPWTVSVLLVSSGFSVFGCDTAAVPTETEDSRPAAGLAASYPDGACPGAATSQRAGQLDTTFGDAGTGIARVRFGADDDGAFFDLDVVGSDIVAAGWGAGGLGGSKLRVARLDAAGRPDPAFGGGGMVTTLWAPSTADYAYAVAVGHQRDGSVVAMGWRDRFRSESANVAMVRYAPDGSIGGGDFGASGKSLIDLGGAEEILDGQVVQGDAIVVVGRRDDHLVVARATSKGALDTSFARPAGYWTQAVGHSSTARAVAVDQNGRIVVVGSADRSGQLDMVVLRLTANGELDPTFGAGGMVVTGDPTLDERAVAVALSPDGRIVVAGDAGRPGAGDFQVRRLLANGAPDTAFGVAGEVSSAISDGDDQAEEMVLLPSGGIVVVGNTVTGADTNKPLLARYTCQGALDSAFGRDGVLPLDLGQHGVVHAARVYSRDKVVIGGGDVGMSPGPGTYGVVARLWM